MLFAIKALIAFIQEAKYDYKKKKPMSSRDIFIIVTLVGCIITTAATVNKATRLATSLKACKEKVTQLEDELKSKNQRQASSDSGNSIEILGFNGLTSPGPRTDCLSLYCIP